MRLCPLCGNLYDTYPATSRRYPYPSICPDCGMREALEAFEKGSPISANDDNLTCITGKSKLGICGMRVCAEQHGVMCCGECTKRKNCNSACGWLEVEDDGKD